MSTKKLLTKKNITLLVSLLVAIFSAVAYPEVSKSNTSNNSNATIQVQSTTTAQTLLTFNGKGQLVLGELDKLNRATFAHIQLQNKDEPTKKRTTLTYNPVGWHNYNFYYGDGTNKAWLMSRGHLVGYQFSGLNDEPRNLVPETTWMNAGNYDGANDSNNQSMLYYENRLDKWLANHPDDWLDYQVTPIYQNNELLPRQVQLSYVGLDNSGNKIKISFNSSKESTDDQGVTHVTLDNTSPNAKINYLTGTATNTVTKK